MLSCVSGSHWFLYSNEWCLQPCKHTLPGRVTAGSQTRHSATEKSSPHQQHLESLSFIIPSLWLLCRLQSWFQWSNCFEKKRNSKKQGKRDSRYRSEKISNKCFAPVASCFHRKIKNRCFIYCSHSTVYCAFIYFLQLFPFFPSHLLIKEIKDTNSIDTEKKQTDETFFIMVKIIFKTKTLLTMFFSESKYQNYSSQRSLDASKPSRTTRFLGLGFFYSF